MVLALVFIYIRLSLCWTIFELNVYVFFVLFFFSEFLNLNFSILSFYLPFTHPDSKIKSTGIRKLVEERYGEYFPTGTPEFPGWVHYYVFLGLTYHIEHHVFPEVPWYNLWIVHNDLKRILTEREVNLQPTLFFPKCSY